MLFFFSFVCIPFFFTLNFLLKIKKSNFYLGSVCNNFEDVLVLLNTIIISPSISPYSSFMYNCLWVFVTYFCITLHLFAGAPCLTHLTSLKFLYNFKSCLRQFPFYIRVYNVFENSFVIDLRVIFFLLL